MPRRSSRVIIGRPTPRAARRPAPMRNAPSPAAVQNNSGGSMLGGLGATIAQGMAFGSGSAVAHGAVDSVMGPRTIQHETIASESPAPVMSGSDVCSNQNKAFQDVLGILLARILRRFEELRLEGKGKLTADLLLPQRCLNHSESDISNSRCQFYIDMLNECRRESGSTTT